jgi:hypothetical protein
MKTTPWIVLAALLGVLPAALGRAAAADENEALPEGVEQIIPRGRIPAIFEPQFVPAEAADLPHEAWILGVVVEGQARAYSLNLLNSHEIVNDRIGETAFAAVW